MTPCDDDDWHYDPRDDYAPVPPKPGVFYDEDGCEMQDPEEDPFETAILAEEQRVWMEGFFEQERRKWQKVTDSFPH